MRPPRPLPGSHCEGADRYITRRRGVDHANARTEDALGLTSPSAHQRAPPGFVRSARIGVDAVAMYLG